MTAPASTIPNLTFADETLATIRAFDNPWHDVLFRPDGTTKLLDEPTQDPTEYGTVFAGTVEIWAPHGETGWRFMHPEGDHRAIFYDPPADPSGSADTAAWTDQISPWAPSAQYAARVSAQVVVTDPRDSNVQHRVEVWSSSGPTAWGASVAVSEGLTVWKRVGGTQNGYRTRAEVDDWIADAIRSGFDALQASNR